MDRLLLTLLIWVFGAVFVAINGKDETTSPNILFIMMDDMGYGDLSARGGEFETPNLDSLYSDSIVLNSHYVGLSVCSPSRSQILSGRYAWNMGLSDLTNFQTSSISSMPAGLPTIGNLFQQYSSYETYSAGKWHVGYSTYEHTPLYRGFDEFYGFLTTGITYSDKTMSEPIYDGDFIDWWANEEYDYDTQYTFSTTVTMDKINSIVSLHSIDEDTSSSSDPFYIYGAFQAPHETLEYVSSTHESNCDDILDDNSVDVFASERYTYCANIMKMDDVIGEIVSNLKETNLWDNTLIVFTSDNGGAYYKGGCNYPLSGGKGTFFEGGVRTVAFVGGGYISEEQRGSERNGFFHGSDWTPTLLSIAGIDVEQVSDDLQANLYKPVAAKLSVKLHNSDELSDNYLIDTSFDGIDLSQWLLFGDETLNPRTNVPLSINSLPSNSQMLKDESEDYDVGDISIVFQSQVTNNVYKLMYLASSDDEFDIESCGFEETEETDEDDFVKTTSKTRLMSIKTYTSNQLLFDLTLDSTEKTNLMENIDTGSDDDDDVAVMSMHMGRRLMSDKYFDNIMAISDYNDNDGLVKQLWSEAESIISEYSNNVLFSDYLTCSEKIYSTDGDPSQFEIEGWQPFYSWNEFVSTFNTLCGDDTNELLMELYTTTYADLMQDALSADVGVSSSDNDNNHVDDATVGNVKSGNSQRHMFGSNHIFMTVGILVAISMVLVGYCLFYLVKRKNTTYQQYTAIGP